MQCLNGECKNIPLEDKDYCKDCQAALDSGEAFIGRNGRLYQSWAEMAIEVLD